MTDYEGYESIVIEVEHRVVTATVTAGPMNLISRDLLQQFDRLVTEVSADPEPLVLVLKSGTPGFFIGHAKFSDLDVLKGEHAPTSIDDVPMNPVQSLCQRLRAMDKVSIAQVEGRATGGGAAIAMACDLRFASLESAIFNSFGVPLGTGMGGGATQLMPRLVGRARAMELILGAKDLDAATADAWGYVNRALPPDEIGMFVKGLALRISLGAPEVIRRTKRLIAEAEELALVDGFRAENFSLQQMAGTPAAAAGVAAFLELGGETLDGEHRLEILLGEVLEHAERNR